jgi:hypothetical protein
LEHFTDVSNTSSSNSPGNMNFYPFGQPFVDPGFWEGTVQFGHQTIIGIGESIVPFGPALHRNPAPETTPERWGRLTGHVIGFGIGVAELFGGGGLALGGGGVTLASFGITTPVSGLVAIVGAGVCVLGAVTIFQTGLLIQNDIALMMAAPNELGHQPGGGQRPVAQEQGPFLGNNPRPGAGNRVNTDMPGGENAARRIFDRLTGGNHRADPSGQLIGPNGERLRRAADGTWRVEIPGHGNTPHETIHFN